MNMLLRKVAVAAAALLAFTASAFAIDLTVTAASVLPTATTVIIHGTCGATAITAGQPVYLDANNLLQPAKANASGTANIVGVALDNCAASQPLSYGISGHVTYNAGLTKGVAVYISQANAGGLAPVADITSGNFPVVVGIATSTTDLLLGFVDVNVSL